MQSPAYLHWCRQLRSPPVLHRKVWEWAYILQTLALAGMLAPGRKGVGFGVGDESMPDVIASYGCDVLATDMPHESAKAAGWIGSNQHAKHLDELHQGYTDKATFLDRMRFSPLDMNDIPVSVRDFDFAWSSCAFEHLGSIDLGLRFVEESLETVRPGGVVVHTTELNCTSDVETLETGDTVLFRASDFTKLAARLRAQGHGVELNFNLGDLPHDKHVDAPPYTNDPHLKLQLGRFVTTSFGLSVVRGARR